MAKGKKTTFLELKNNIYMNRKKLFLSQKIFISSPFFFEVVIVATSKFNLIEIVLLHF